MKKILLLLTLCIYYASSFGQQELLSNGSFSQPNNQWFGTATSQYLNNYNGGNYCPQSSGNTYNFFGDAQEQTGADNMIEGIYQDVSIPANSASVTLTFRMSINTLEPFDPVDVYDYLFVNVLSPSGAYLQNLLTIDNSFGSYGIPGCATWFTYTVDVPSSFFGQSLQLAFQASTDVSYPTIFRIDDASLISFAQAPCSYTLSSNSYTCPTAAGGTYPSVATVNTQSGCAWSATVLTGASWLSTNSQGTGSGSVNITVTQNTSSSPRTGTISVGGQTLTVTQPGESCAYTLSSNSYTCPTAAGGTYPSVATVNTQSGCAWSATVLTGASWLSTNSQGTGSGSVNITVTQNTSSSPRTGTISVGGQTLTVTQPGESCAYTVSSNNYICENSSAATLNSIALVNTAAGCGWSALVTSGISWLACSSSGDGSGFVNIIVLENTTGAIRTGTVDIQGEVITIIQPESSVSVEEMSVNNALAFFPNPTHGILTVENPAAEKQGLRISNGLGQVVRYEMLGSGKNVIDLTSLSNGVYFIQLGDSKVEKLVVN